MKSISCGLFLLISPISDGDLWRNSQTFASSWPNPLLTKFIYFISRYARTSLCFFDKFCYEIL
jgi:hypothetical protein